MDEILTIAKRRRTGYRTGHSLRLYRRQQGLGLALTDAREAGTWGAEMSTRMNIRLLAIPVVLALLMLGLPTPAAHATASCGNAIACENQLPGTPQSVWDDGTDDQSILGYATQMSVNVGGSIDFKVNTDAHAYTIDVYRLGYYQGNGARKITSVPVTATLPQSQPACLRDTATDLFDCGNWAVSASWQVPANAVSGVYIADLTRTDTSGQSQITFVVRNDASHADVQFQTSDTTWQAYNTYGGASLYQGISHDRGYKVSYNRPFITRDGGTMHDFLYANEYPTIRFLESNGVDVSYISGLDIAMGQGHLTNHKVFLSVGHDEYWSGSQRDAVTQARDAGVNLMFLSGNEAYWHTRWESSIDGNGTPFRTMVCYKDTRERTPIDPVSPTATWRDPRYAGFSPENALTGTMYVGQGTNLPVQVTSAQGQLRLWRNTGLASLAAGTTGTLGSDIVGYEIDGVVDNGFAPAGQITASTTTAAISQVLQDFGLNVAPGTISHHFSEYRAASGALVFAAGTIQYAWGLDGTHDLSTHGAIPEIQQLTINLLADMGVQPTSLQAGLVAASASGDHTAPVVSITSPASGPIPFGTQITVSGTATDAGGHVAGVEVSVDGGATWHPATGTATWSYTGVVLSYAGTAVQVRATDDSLNTSSPVSPSGVTVTGPNTIFGDVTPATTDSGDATANTLGMVFVPITDGFVSGVRFYKSAANTGTHTGTLYTSTGTVLATGTFTNESASGWQQLTFTTPAAVSAGTKYVVAYYAPVGHYAYAPYFFAPGPITSGNLTAIGGLGVANGVYASGTGFPAQTYQQSNYYVDPLFTSAGATPLRASAVSPGPGAGSVLTNATVVGIFNKDPGDTSMAISLAGAGGAAVQGASAYDPVSRQLTFTAIQPLAFATTFTATVTDAGLSTPFTWSFTSVGAPRTTGLCPCSLFQDTDQPTTVATNDAANLVLGVAFTPSQNGTITAIRYWKPLGLAGPNPVTLYGPTGTALGTATPSAGTTVGWQTATFSVPVAVSSGTTYTAAVAYPQGGYPYAYNFYAAPLTVGPLTTPANAGRYLYGTGFPTGTTATTYYVDPVFFAGPPTVVSASPGNGARSVPVNDSLTVTFSVPIASGSGTLTLTGPSGAVPGTVTGTATSRTFTPTAALASATSYVLSVNGAATVDGIVQTQAYTETITTSGASACPCSLLETTLAPQQPVLNDGSALTLGLRFTPLVSGSITGLRYWRAASNTGTHTGTLYAANGAVLATVTFVDGAEGWQQASFATPVSVSAGATYVASYFSPSGGYSATTSFFTTQVSNPPLASMDSGGVFGSGNVFPNQSVGVTNYFVDVVFSTATVLSTPPAVLSVSPGDAARSVPTSTAVSVTFSEPIVSGSGTVTLTGPSGAVAGTVAETSTSRTFTPASALAEATPYVLKVTGATTSDGVVQTQAYSETFTTSGPSACPCSLLETTLAPQQPYLANGSALTLGLKFTPTVNGYITGLRYWRAASNTGTHTGKLYAADGTVLATLTFVDGAEGWQQALFSSPVSVTAGTPYYASYYSPAGTYSVTTNFFGTPLSNPPLASVDSGGVFASGDAFPNQPFGASNYFVDVVFTTTTAVVAPSVASVTPVAGASGVAVTSPVTVTFSGSLNPSSVSVTLTGPGGTAVPGTLAVNAPSATFTPAAALAGNTAYTVTVAASTPGGTAMAPFSSTFTTASSVSVASTTPAANATGAALASTVGVTFAGSLSPSSVSLTLTPSGGAAVAGTLATTATTATFTPSAALAESTVYTATVKASSSSGAVMAPVTWTFSTTSSAPVIASRTPAVSATGVLANSTVQVTFTKAVDPTTPTLSLVNASGVAVAGALVKTATTVTFTPSALLAANTKYTATVGASSPVGTAMTPAAWSFTTETAPIVSAITPANGATTASNTTTVRASFNKAVSTTSIKIVVTDPSGTVVPGRLATTTTVGTFTPSALLTPGTLYRVTAAAALADGLASTPFSSSFTTGAAVSIFAGSQTPASSTTSATPLTVGVNFRATSAYSITGIRFYLPANWTSTYTVALWSSTGTKLATASGSPTSTTDGWRVVNLTTPVRIAANTTYVASVRSLGTQYSSTPLSFLTAYTNGTFTVPAAGAVTSSADVFPTATSTTNYFVDVVAAP
jgi:methionine-rich copper-binding protein CopC